MKKRLTSLMMNLPTVDDVSVTAVPEWVHLMPAGTFSGADGRGPYIAGDLQQIVAQFRNSGRKLPLDINHSTDKLGTQGFESPAVGWIVDMEAREDGMGQGRMERSRQERHRRPRIWLPVASALRDRRQAAPRH
ncbi:hypothetical protein HED55_16620 [Ochrobactrum haematophilum]|uniref:Uncharacterized protein n=1 Tax=Brucella haematophila TaxID=419474 RepID=A0ABX1DMX8_9HYPH|nr:hypothetical protein [Brucella haematophila]